LWAVVYLLDHGWWVLVATCAVALLLVSAILLMTYQHMWNWQETMLVPRRAIIVEDDDDSFQNWMKKLGCKGLILFGWTLYCVANTKLDYWIFRQYISGHPDHNLELYLVNWLEAGPILVGAAYTMYYFYPPFYVTATGSMASTGPGGTLQSLL